MMGYLEIVQIEKVCEQLCENARAYTRLIQDRIENGEINSREYNEILEQFHYVNQDVESQRVVLKGK